MAVLIDPPAWPAHGRLWSHLISDSSLAELHSFAKGVGAPPRGFEGDHYDVPEERYASIVAAGALPVTGRELLRRLQASGLRRSKRRGERVLASRPHGPSGDRLDALSSTLPPTGVVAAVTLVVERHGTDCADLLVVPDGPGLRLPRSAVSPGQGTASAAADLLARTLGGLTDPRSGPAQIGFLRLVPYPTGAATEFDVVLHWTAPGPTDRVDHDPAPPARWIAADRAVGAIEPMLAALLTGDRSGAAPPRRS